MQILMTGGTGHIGRFLVPMLAKQGHQVTVVSRHATQIARFKDLEHVQVKQAAYATDPPENAAWRSWVTEQNAEVVIDILGSDVPGTYEAAKGTCQHYIACGSLWMLGPPRTAPTPAITQNPCAFSGYARRYGQMQATFKQAQADGIAFSAIMPPNICGPGKVPLDCQGGRSVQVHQSHQRGEPVVLPQGCLTLIGPCDAEDIASAFRLAVQHRDAAAGEMFNVGSAYALSATELVKTFGDIYHVEIPIEYVSHETFYTKVLPDPGAHYHFSEHMLPDIGKLRTKLGYEPAYTPQQTLKRAVDWMREEGLI